MTRHGRQTLLLMLLSGLVIASCAASTGTESTESTETEVASPSPAAIQPDSATAQANQTTPQQPSGYTLTPVVEGLEHPWGIAWLPDGDLLITERPGRLRIVRDGTLDPTPISGVPSVLVDGQAGLLDIALHPQFEQNRLVYLTYASGDSQSNRTEVARAEFDGTSLQNLEVIFRVNRQKYGTQHFGSRLVWLPDGTLLVSIGDGGNPPVELDGDLIRKQAQNLSSYLGKVVRINDDGTIPNDNPFVSTADAAPAVWSYGHRNIQGMTYDPLQNRVWVSEHGARGGDELNLVEAGKNYGWPLVSHSREYSTGQPVAPTQSQPGMVDPKIVWPMTVAPSGLTVYTGDVFPDWRGNVFAGGLRTGNVHRIQVNANGNATEVDTIAINQRVRDIRQGPDGLLYVLTDENDGQLLRIDPRP
ncbi:PQQ-dependent sugar dehydrogenase [Oscillatoria sp. FACHB-1407]|uniref:PQQ-dependent sugar dehydrogenase n=1 Tax=Oscillatoria sp. FACHB-1407 TaxID=2692847 RepID=UPI0016888AE4|nr:PQQ-dependent sugar dehydrogenase [Oscillatoria sp. FACHB-1407]MBD2464882.1 PQQ-dependent sugar dehydrogenase [Oscillatoria sp. FACHB-1407]